MLELRNEDGQGLVEMLIALTILTIAIGALISVLVAGATALQRTDQKGTATTLADKQMELYRTFAYSNIRLNSSLLPAGGAAYYTGAPASTACTSGVFTNCLVALGSTSVNGETPCTTVTGLPQCAPVQKTTIKRSGTLTNASTTVSGLSSTSDLFVGFTVTGTGLPSGTTISSITNGTTIVLSAAATSSGATSLTFNEAPDHRIYEIDTYITYNSPASGVPHGAKEIRVIVRDASRTGNPILAREDSIFSPLTAATS